MNENIITIDGLRRSYHAPGSSPFGAVRGVDLTIARGELFALLGTNGAGKTSLMEVVEGMALPTAGRVRVLGHDPYVDRRRIRPHTGIMLQEAGFPADLKVSEMVRTWGRTLSRPRPVAEMIDAVGLSHRSDVAIKSLSGGERRRLDLALAIMGRPDVLCLDEPTTGLDPESRRGAWGLVRSLIADGVTVVLTTHYLEEAEELADRLAIMHEGRIVREGTPAQIVAGEPARITFSLPRGAEAPPPLRGRHAVTESHLGVRHEITTDQMQADLGTLLWWADARGVELGALDARAASLEQAFQAIVDGSTPRTVTESEVAA